MPDGGVRDAEDGAYTQEEPPEKRPELRREGEAGHLAEERVVVRRVRRELLIVHLVDVGEEQQHQGDPRLAVRLGQREEVLESSPADGDEALLHLRPLVLAPRVGHHAEQDAQRARQALRLLLQQVGLHAALKAGLPQQVSLVVVRVEGFGE